MDEHVLPRFNEFLQWTTGSQFPVLAWTGLHTSVPPLITEYAEPRTQRPLSLLGEGTVRFCLMSGLRAVQRKSYAGERDRKSVV